MTADDCAEFELLMQADFDGELDVSSAAKVAAHLAQCESCRTMQAEFAGLSKRLRADIPARPAPARLREAIEAALTAETAPAAKRRPWFDEAREWMSELWTQRGMSFGAGAALAAALAVAIVPRHGADAPASLADSVIASHIRALQPGHLMDVVSTDQHTVKPWFDGRLDFAPPVKDLATQGYALVGGRLDYLAGRPVAALAYRHGQHLLDLYVWPASRGIEPASAGQVSGYNFSEWTGGAMRLWAVSDMSKPELDDFVDLWKAAK